MNRLNVVGLASMKAGTSTVCSASESFRTAVATGCTMPAARA